jgi:DNA-binding response OmpR family regulator
MMIQFALWKPGANECVTNPFSVRELTARLRALVHRTFAQEMPEITMLRAGALKMDLKRRLVGGRKEMHLSPKEFELLK